MVKITHTSLPLPSPNKSRQSPVTTMENVGNSTKKCLSCAAILSLFARECKQCGTRYDDEVEHIEKTIKTLDAAEEQQSNKQIEN